MANQRIRIRLKSFDHRLIDQSAQEIVDTLAASEDQACQRLCQDLYKSLNISNNLPNLAILSSMHEEQYSRLFRS